MAAASRKLAYRLAALVALGGAVVTGGMLALKTRDARPGTNPATRPGAGPDARTRAALARARTITAPSADGGPPVPVATVVPPVDAAAPRRSLPAALLNPEANLRMAYDLALGRPEAREVLFTFDDGPNPGTTDRLLGYLDRYHIKAIFFVCGWRLEADEPLRTRARNVLRDTFARGHTIGNHTIHHYNMANLSAERAAYEIDHNADLIHEVIGQRPHYFRPPYGSYSEDVRRHVISRGDELTLWSADSHDWQMVGDAQGVAMRVITTLGNMAGGTVLLHDIHPWSVAAAQMVFRWLETENRDRTAHGRTPYRVLDPAEFMEGERARLPMLEQLRAEHEARAREERRQARHAARDGGGEGASEQVATAGNAGMGAPAPAPGGAHPGEGAPGGANGEHPGGGSGAPRSAPEEHPGGAPAPPPTSPRGASAPSSERGAHQP